MKQNNTKKTRKKKQVNTNQEPKFYTKEEYEKAVNYYEQKYQNKYLHQTNDKETTR